MTTTLETAVRSRVQTDAIKLPMLPTVLAQVMTVVRDPRSNIDDLSKLIDRDPNLAAHALKMANSAGAGGVRKIGSIKEATSRLGMRSIAAMVMAASVRREVFNVPGHEKAVEEMWHQALLRAGWAREIAKKTKHPPDEAFMCGLMQQIGRPLALKTIVTTANDVGDAPDALAIRHMPTDFQAPLGERLAPGWKLPDGVGACIRSPDAIRVDPNHPILVRLVSLADKAALWSVGKLSQERVAKHPLARAFKSSEHDMEWFLLQNGPKVRDFADSSRS